jgi:hypothetical protein
MTLRCICAPSPAELKGDTGSYELGFHYSGLFKICERRAWEEAQPEGAFHAQRRGSARRLHSFLHRLLSCAIPPRSILREQADPSWSQVTQTPSVIGSNGRSRAAAIFFRIFTARSLWAAVLWQSRCRLRPTGSMSFRANGVIGLLEPLVRAPFLRLLDAETAHRLAIQALKLPPHVKLAAADPRLAVRAFGLNFPNPIGMAAGFDKHGEVPDPLLRLGFGFVEVGTVTPQPQGGNPRPRVFRLPRDRAVINRLGFNSKGAATCCGGLPRANEGGIVGINIGANKDSADRISDYVRLIEHSLRWWGSLR